MSKKPVKRKRLGKNEFAVEYVRNSILFDGETPTEEDINSTYNLVKNSGKRKRVKRNPEPELSKEEYFAMIVHSSQLLWGITPTEEDLDREWDIEVIRRTHKTLKGGKAKADYLENMGQIIKARYSSNHSRSSMNFENISRYGEEIEFMTDDELQEYCTEWMSNHAVYTKWQAEGVIAEMDEGNCHDWRAYRKINSDMLRNLDELIDCTSHKLSKKQVQRLSECLVPDEFDDEV